MSKLDVAPSALKAVPTPDVAAAPAVTALITMGSLFEILATWDRLMRAQVFVLIDLPDAKLAKTYQRRLLAQQAMAVLMVVWKDSDQVSDDEIEAAGVERTGAPCQPINCHNLAKRMAVSIDDYDKQEKIIQGIVDAAEAYGLLAREPFKNTRQRMLRGTALLHVLMLAFDEEVRPICADIAASDPGGQ